MSDNDWVRSDVFVRRPPRHRDNTDTASRNLTLDALDDNERRPIEQQIKEAQS